jgi:indole-3-glycerol phosphate synthase
MSETFLEKILNTRRERVAEAKRRIDLEGLCEKAFLVRSNVSQFRLRNALSTANSLNIIAEIKRASPSKGVINADADVDETAQNYATGGACSISVLTEEDFFKGSLDDLRAVRKAVDLPVLRKDFVIDEYQIYEAAEAGADAILLIVAALTEENLKNFLRLAQTDLGMDALVEVHTREELDIAEKIGASIIGVNNRDLKTFEVSLDISRQLIAEKSEGFLMIAESGIVSKDEMLELRDLGFDGFLVGETLMRSGNPKEVLEAWV